MFRNPRNLKKWKIIQNGNKYFKYKAASERLVEVVNKIIQMLTYVKI